MRYLYHKVPAKQFGHTLYSLNKLKEIDKDSYQAALKKYQGRPDTQKQVIPLLNVLWNDVIHLSPIHPKDLKHELELSGGSLSGRYYKIPLSVLEVGKAIVYMYQHEEKSEKFNNENWKRLSEVNFDEISILTPRTSEYYKKTLSEKNKLFIFHTIPHILYHGELNTSEFEIIDL